MASSTERTSGSDDTIVRVIRYSQALSERLEIKASSHTMLTDWGSLCSKRFTLIGIGTKNIFKYFNFFQELENYK